MKIYVDYQEYYNSSIYKEDDPELDVYTRKHSALVEIDDAKAKHWFEVIAEFYKIQKEMCKLYAEAPEESIEFFKEN
jgi:hypothetical protein